MDDYLLRSLKVNDLTSEELYQAKQYISALARRNRFLSLEDIENLPEPEWLIPNWLQKDSLAMLYAPSGQGKTFVALHWSLSLAQEGRRVLYVAAEGAFGLSRRVTAWRKRYGNVPANQIFFDPQGTLVDRLKDETADPLLLSEVSTFRPELIVVDTLARNIEGDENAARDAGAFIRGLDTLRLLSGACVLTIHHSGKDPEKGARGSSALKAAMDTEIFIQHRKGSSSYKLQTTKQKNAPDDLSTSFSLKEENGSLVFVEGNIQEAPEVVVSEGETDDYLYLTSSARLFISRLPEGTLISGSDLQERYDIPKKRWDTFYAPRLKEEGLLRTEGRRYYRTEKQCEEHTPTKP